MMKSRSYWSKMKQNYSTELSGYSFNNIYHKNCPTITDNAKNTGLSWCFRDFLKEIKPFFRPMSMSDPVRICRSPLRCRALLNPLGCRDGSPRVAILRRNEETRDQKFTIKHVKNDIGNIFEARISHLNLKPIVNQY